MQDILEKVNINSIENITREDLMIIILKAHEICTWNIDNIDIWKDIEKALERFTLSINFGNKKDDEDLYKYCIAVLHPLIKRIEEYYNNNAPVFVPEETKDEFKTRICKSQLTTILLNIQTMDDNGWNYGSETKRNIFKKFKFITNKYLNLLDNCNKLVLKDDVIDGFNQLTKEVNEEFNKFLQAKLI